MTEVWQPLPTGTVLRGRYEIVALLGKGGFGATYRAHDRGRGNVDCVVKELLPKHEDNTNVRRLFEREARVLETLRNPGIPALQAYFSTAERHYLVQDFVDGVTLEEMLQRRGRLPETEIVDILDQVLRILAYLHGLTPPVIHRDIKPANIMRGPDGRVSLLDFGAVKEAVGQVQAESSGTVDMYRESVVVYSKGYAPPEQLRGAVAPASDLYALGATALHLLTGRTPERWYDALAGEWGFRGQLGVAPRLEAVLIRLLEDQMSRRFRSADQVLDALHRGGDAGTTELIAGALPMNATLAGRYVIEAVMERHPDETAYRAHDREALNRACIVRAFVPPGGGTAETRAAFEREGRVLAAVSSPSMPRLGAFFEEGGTCYAIEELIDGQPLVDAIRPGAGLSQSATARALRAALETLEHLHKQSPPIVHRAVQPAHLIRTADGRVFLTGCGGLREAVLGRGRAMGYVASAQAYQAPGSNTRPAEPADDLYALGVTGVYLLTAVLPGESPGLDQVVGVDPKFRAFLERLREPSPAARFASARDALTELNGIDLKEDAGQGAIQRKNDRDGFKRDKSFWEKWLPSGISKNTAIVIGIVATIGLLWWMRPGPPPQTPPVPQVRVLYSNDLWNQRSFKAGRTPSGCQWGYGEGGFIVGNLSQGLRCPFYTFEPIFPGNIRIEVTARLLSGDQSSSFGLMFGVSNRNNEEELYGYWITANGGHSLWRYLRGEAYKLYDWKRDGVVKQGYGAANLLAVEIQGTKIVTMLNGKRVGWADAPDEVRGSVGFYVGMPGMEAVFNDLRVLGLPGS